MFFLGGGGAQDSTHTISEAAERQFNWPPMFRAFTVRAFYSNGTAGVIIFWNAFRAIWIWNVLHIGQLYARIDEAYNTAGIFRGRNYGMDSPPHWCRSKVDSVLWCNLFCMVWATNTRNCVGCGCVKNGNGSLIDTLFNETRRQITCNW